MEREVHEASVVQAALLLGVSASTVRRWLGSGKLDGHRRAEGRGTPWRVLLPPELPAAAASLQALIGGQSPERLRAIERQLVEVQRALEQLRSRLDELDVLDQWERGDGGDGALSAPAVEGEAQDIETFQAEPALEAVAAFEFEESEERERALVPVELAVVRAARLERSAPSEVPPRWPPPTVTSIMLGQAQARYELPPLGEGIGWLRARRRRWPRRA